MPCCAKSGACARSNSLSFPVSSNTIGLSRIVVATVEEQPVFVRSLADVEFASIGA